MMIRQFITTCRENSHRPALVCNGRSVTFGRLLKDVYRMAELVQARGISSGSKVLLFVLPSYEFYVLLFSCIYCGVNVVAMDSYRDLNRVRRMAKENGAVIAFCDGKTKFLAPLFPSVKFVNVAGYEAFPGKETIPRNDPTLPVLTTFTSGTTGAPKPIHRTLRDLEEQIRTVSRNISLEGISAVYGGLPVYALFSVFSGVTTVISPKIRKKELEPLGVTAVFAPIARMLTLLKEIFPRAETTYVYGSSECVLMAKGDPEYYLAHDFALDPKIEGVKVSVIDPDSYGIGRIKAEGDVVLTGGTAVGGDLGYLDEYGLHVVGRAAYSREGQYNYLTDHRILSANPKVKRGFSFVWKEKVCFCYEGVLSVREEGIVYRRFRKLPMDAKHMNFTRG